MKLSEDVAFVLHEQWRKTRLKEDGSYEPRWKKIKDTDFIAKFEGKDLPNYVRNTENGYEIDIANACYTQLSADWQNENKAASEVVAKIVESGEQLSRDEIGDIIHNAWLERNAWAKDGELGVPFANLPKQKRQRYSSIDLAYNEPAKVEDRYINRLEEVANFLGQRRKRGQICLRFNGHTLYSEIDTQNLLFESM